MVTEFKVLRPTARLFIGLVVLAGASVIGHSVYELAVDPIGNRWIILAVLTLLTGSFNVKVPSINAYISVSEAFVFASILLFGTPAGTATVVIECMVVVLWMKPEARLVHRVLFNMAAPSVSVWTAGTAFYVLSGIEPYSKVVTPLPELFFPLLVFTALYFLLNSWLVAIAVGLENHRSPIQIWWKNFAWLSVNYFSGASLAALIVTYTQQLDFSALAVIIPLLVVSYLTFRTAMGRAEDSYNHLAELNRLYLSTIETLAMAIDAKDQITHGHIRRVQTYAVGLAKRVGVSDEKLLKAIEAAALLHDMGKLAVPEHILNKPGKLTPAEFEKMKLHASVGADILSAIDFPYPVVPIVRHHHENWNGTGYPDGVKGTDIPIGARILSVVDCFDALTSDRPYRPRLSDDEALTILLERRGSMYDPLVVDTFVRVHRDIAPDQTVPTETRAPLKEITGSSAGHRSSRTTRSDDVPELADDTRAMPGLAAALAGQRNVAATGETIARYLRRVVPFSLSILYLYDVGRDELVAEHVSGEASYLVKDLRMSRGERLSGWVAANRQPIVNSDPMLDLGDISKATTPPLRTSLSVPLMVHDELVGVLTLYSATERFTDDHRRLVEMAGRHAARSVQQRHESVAVRV
jgi:putative nucleotidyltransferase with HDIG domain